jgi:uncharacterized protein
MGRGWAYPVRLDPVTGGVVLSEHERDIRQSVRIILGTTPGERVRRPDFGCGIHRLTFEVVDTALMTRIDAAVRDAMKRFEARIEVLNVEIDPTDSNGGTLMIKLHYRVRQTNQTGNVVYPFAFREAGTGSASGSRS